MRLEAGEVPGRKDIVERGLPATYRPRFVPMVWHRQAGFLQPRWIGRYAENRSVGAAHQILVSKVILILDLRLDSC